MAATEAVPQPASIPIAKEQASSREITCLQRIERFLPFYDIPIVTPKHVRIIKIA
jgi:hypothetical protein